MTHKKRKFGEIVRELMQARGLKSAELANLIGIPRASIQRIITGVTSNPAANTLISLAGFFNVTVDYLLGSPSSQEPPSITIPHSDETPPNAPVLDWSQVKAWLYAKQELDLESLEWIPIKDVTHNSFAIKNNKFPLREVFPMDSLMIIDPEETHGNNDYVLVCVDKNYPTIRQIGEDFGDFYLHSVGAMMPSVKLEPPHTILGKVVEYRVKVN